MSNNNGKGTLHDPMTPEEMEKSVNQQQEMQGKVETVEQDNNDYQEQ